MPDNPILTVLVAVFASGGFWAFMTAVINRKHAKNDELDTKINLMADVLKGMGHDRIVYLGGHYIKRGYVTIDELDNLEQYLYKPYEKLGGNGTAKTVMEKVRQLPHNPVAKN